MSAGAKYVRHDWACGETISADRLNNIENGVQEALAEAKDKGYSCTEIKTVLFNGNVTTTYDSARDATWGTLPSTFGLVEEEEYLVTFDNVNYHCVATVGYLSRVVIGTSVDGDWSQYPFFTNGQQIVTRDAGTYSLKVEHVQTVVTADPCFEKVVEEIRGYRCKSVRETLFNDVLEDTTTFDGGLPTYVTTLYITFDDVDYVCPVYYEGDSVPVGASWCCGDEDLSQYPFFLLATQHTNDTNLALTASTSGTHTVQIDYDRLDADVDACFSSAVDASLDCDTLDYSTVVVDKLQARTNENTINGNSPLDIVMSTGVRGTNIQPVLQGIRLGNGLEKCYFTRVFFSYEDGEYQINVRIYNPTSNPITFSFGDITIEYVTFDVRSYTKHVHTCSPKSSGGDTPK